MGEKTKTLSNKTSSKFELHQTNPLNTLNDIYNQFAVTPVDKAIGNVAFICRRFHAIFLRKELGLDLNNTGTNKTYIPVHKTNNQVITGHIIFLRNKLSLVVHEENKTIPNFYWIPNPHKHPSKARFIIVAWGKQVIVVAKFGAIWTDSKSKFRITFDKGSLKLAVNFLLDNCFFNFGYLSFG